MHGPTHHAQAQNHAAPEQHVVEQATLPNVLAPLHQHNRHLQHHGHEAVAAEFARNAAHDQLVRKTGNEKGDECRHGSRHGVARSAVDVPPEEVVNGNVPLAGKLQPVKAVPPVRVELPVGKALDVLIKGQ